MRKQFYKDLLDIVLFIGIGTGLVALIVNILFKMFLITI